MESLTWIVDHRVEIIITLIGILVACEAIVRLLEGIVKLLQVFAGWTSTKKDDEALEGAAKWLCTAAERIATMTAFLRPFSLRGTPQVVPVVMGVDVTGSPGTSVSVVETLEDTSPGGIRRRDGFIEARLLLVVALLGFVVVAALASGCGGGLADLDPEEVHQAGCELTEEACDLCERSQALYCAEGSAAKSEARCTATGVLCAGCALSERLFCGGEPSSGPASSGGELPAGSGGT